MASPAFTYLDLKTRHRSERDTYCKSLSLRTHRALSWLDRAERETEDHDARFLFLWIAFNAAYANESRDLGEFSEREVLNQFLSRLVASDTDSLLHEIIWQQFSSHVRVLIDNQYVYQPFWRYQSGQCSEEEWRAAFEKSKAAAHHALGKMDTAKVLGIIFDRLYTLRNQLVHGGATWNGAVNRAQMRDGVGIMGQLVPTIIHLMMDDGERVWGEACYPVVE